MNQHLLMAFIGVVTLLPGNVGAKEVTLATGETYRQGDLTVTCGQALTGDKPMVLKNCQYWDDFNEKCLFEKKLMYTRILNALKNVSTGGRSTAPAIIRQSVLSTRRRSHLCEPPAISLMTSTISASNKMM
jgi:hypothetical protein